MVAWIRGPEVSRVAVSPTLRAPLSALCESMATSPDLAGPRPDTSRSGDSSGSSLQFTPNEGAPCVPIAVPSLPTMTTPPVKTEPSALATPSTPRTVSTMLAGNEADVPAPKLSAAVNSVFGVTVTSVETWVNRSLKVFCRVSVNTSVPDTNATPRTTAAPDSSSRSLCDHSVRKVARSTSGPLRGDR